MVDQTKAFLMFSFNYGEMFHGLVYAKSILESKTPKHRLLLSFSLRKTLKYYFLLSFAVSKTPKYYFLLSFAVSKTPKHCFLLLSTLESKTPKHRFLQLISRARRLNIVSCKEVQLMRVGALCFLSVRGEKWGIDLANPSLISSLSLKSFL
jgi:hypothetical protein